MGEKGTRRRAGVPEWIGALWDRDDSGQNDDRRGEIEQRRDVTTRTGNISSTYYSHSMIEVR